MLENDIKYEDEIDLKNLLHIAWSSKNFIVFFSLIFILTFYLISVFFIQDRYTSGITVLDNDASSSGFLNEISGLASIAGVDIQTSNSSSKKELALEVMNSVDFFEKLYKDDEFAAELMATEKYDLKSQKTIFASSMFNSVSKEWRLDKFGQSVKPSLISGHSEFHEDFFSVIEGDSFIRIEVTHLSPIVAEKWVNKIFKNINLSVQTRDKEDARQSIEFLNEQMRKNKFVFIENNLSGLLTQEMQKLMLSEISDEYVFKVVDSARVPELPSEPNRILITTLGGLIGFTLSLMIALIYGFYSSKKIELNFIPPRIKTKKI